MRKSDEESLKLAREVLSFIESESLTEVQQKKIVADSIDNFTHFVNEGLLQGRKTVSNNYSFVEWEDSGVVIRDAQGNELIDCLGGYGVFLLGHRHPKVMRAIEAQLKRCVLHSQELVDPLRSYLSKLIAYITPGDLQNTYFVCSGSEANEMALKLARLVTGGSHFISTLTGFHGQSFGALSATGKRLFREPFQPLLSGFQHVAYGDAVAMEEAAKKIQKEGGVLAGIIVEPIQGEGGINIPPADYLPQLREICDRYECLLIVDEVQTGLGRTGKMFGVDLSKVVPDIMTLGKALSGGVVPIAAMVSKAKYWPKLEDNTSLLGTSTFGGNPLACAGAIASIKTILEEDIVGQAATKGDYILKNLKDIQGKCQDIMVNVRGRGMFIGMEFASNELGYKFTKQLFEDKILVGGTENNAKVIRFQPPVIISYEQIDKVLQSIRKHLGCCC